MSLRFNGRPVQLETCPTCKGRGRVRIVLFRAGGRMVKCGPCGGTGSVAKTVAVKKARARRAAR